MPAVIVLKVVADDPDFGFLVLRPVEGGGGLSLERELAGGDDIDEIVGDGLARAVDQKIAFEISAAENDQIAERERQAKKPDRARRGIRRRRGRQAVVSEGH